MSYLSMTPFRARRLRLRPYAYAYGGQTWKDKETKEAGHPCGVPNFTINKSRRQKLLVDNIRRSHKKGARQRLKKEMEKQYENLY